ncbi:uncharacterized protein SCHCODRAFT_02752431 [Schizophyllum commune H4-8]|uniref:uncharacterized protein n=1 Tax=Schizophyllum commune (strain H4-8 / FGSC 9210) TaxID=578458 RepID=UPI00215DE1A6|nr:uncharacterized protein SCHCODRAFT_02752431 [Schizophyllum commune H4-8]KAI5886829.1 hypothetical protein SCHCODRAFT_02752431 [Schizophyllum commune H4-8]
MRMHSRHITRHLSLKERLERAASVANVAMLRTYSEPSHVQISTINWLTFLLESGLRTLPPDDAFTRTKILNQLDISRSILAPIRRLPVELLSYIFSIVVKGSPLRTLNVAVTLSHICIAWRRVARAHAALWTTVVIESLVDFDKYRELFFPLTKDMTLELRCDAHEILPDLWDRMALYTSRWRRITLGAHLSVLPELKVLHMERLERLVVFAYDAPNSADLSALDFVVAPHLRHIRLTIDVLQSERQLHVPVARALTSLEIDVMSPFPVTHALPLLRACANRLQSLVLKVRYPLEGPESSYTTSASETFVMEALTLLSLVDSACALLNHIAAPLLDELILSNVPAYGSGSLLHFLARSQAARHLHILRVYQAEEKDIFAWIPCLRLMDNLSQLHFDELLSSEVFLRQLAQLEPPLLPSLEHIAICHIFWNHRELHEAIEDLCGARDREEVVDGEIIHVGLGWIEE